jgi:hypothetical protein
MKLNPLQWILRFSILFVLTPISFVTLIGEALMQPKGYRKVWFHREWADYKRTVGKLWAGEQL